MAWLNLFKKKDTYKSDSSIAKIGMKLDFTATEAYNLLRTNVVFSISAKEDGSGKIIGITSANPSEGKSYTSINLAYALAKDDTKVLVIDADMRKPSIEKTLSIKNEYGLAEILVGRETGEAIQKSVLHDNMDIMTSGTIPPNPSELIGTTRMSELLKRAAQKYDYVIVDLPPVNVVTDALSVSKMVDGYVVVVRHATTGKREIAEAVKKLKYVKARILGVVYNGFSHSGRKYYKSYSYKRYGKYGSYANHYAENTEKKPE